MTTSTAQRGGIQRPELDRALGKIAVEDYLDREGVSYTPSYGTRGLQLNLDECPVCSEGGRKTYINADTGLGNCFHGSCGFKFNKFKLIKAVSGLSGRELDSHITSIAETHGWLPKKERREIITRDLEYPTKMHWLPIDGQNLQYLQDRNVSLESCAWFHLGYCHKGWWKYITQDNAEKFVSYDARVLIPITDLDGTLVSFQGRDVTGTKDPKYLFPTGFAVSGKHLYNAQHFENGVTTHLIVGEGAFDAIAIHQAIAGSSSCVGMLATATFGMHLSNGPDSQMSKFIALKERGLKVVTIMWDAEKAAITEAVKAGLTLGGLGLLVRVAMLPKGYDPAQGPGNCITPPDMVRTAIFQATKLDRLSAIRLLNTANSFA